DRHREQAAHAPVGVNAEHLQVFAAVGLSQLAGVAAPAAQIGLDGTSVARLQAVVSAREFEYLDAEFVAKDAGVGEERLAAGEGVQVGAADADTADTDQGLAGFRVGWWCRRAHEGAGLLQHDLTHEGSSSAGAGLSL